MSSKHVTTGEAAARLETTKPTIVSLIARGELRARRERHGKRHWWMVESSSVDAYRAKHGTIASKRIPRPQRSPGGPSTASRAAVRTDEYAVLERERDDLRAQVVGLREIIARQRTAAEHQRQADEQRALVIRLLLEAAKAAQEADELGRRAFTEIDEAIASLTRAGHAGSL